MKIKRYIAAAMVGLTLLKDKVMAYASQAVGTVTDWEDEISASGSSPTTTAPAEEVAQTAHETIYENVYEVANVIGENLETIANGDTNGILIGLVALAGAATVAMGIVTVIALQKSRNAKKEVAQVQRTNEDGNMTQAVTTMLKLAVTRGHMNKDDAKLLLETGLQRSMDRNIATEKYNEISGQLDTIRGGARPRARRERERRTARESIEDYDEYEDPELEEIDYFKENEIKKHISKFVDKHPEAVASLLRNWINVEEWGTEYTEYEDEIIEAGPQHGTPRPESLEEIEMDDER